jgi:DNA/RNA endonuclease G (NUC1)
MRIRSIKVALCVLLGLTAGYCRSVIRTRMAPGSTVARARSLPDAEQRARMERICFMGCPKLDPEASGIGPLTSLVVRDGYILQHSALDKIPLWVAEHVTKEQLGGGQTRDDKFRPDPDLKPGSRAELADYKRSGFDRGHQAPAGNQTTDARLKAETFYLSNMVPQVPRMNQQIWRELEDLARSWTLKFGETYQITGPMFYDPAEDDPATADGMVSHKAIGKNLVAVPTHIYKIVLARRTPGGPMEAIAFVIENKAFNRPFRFEKFIQSIEWIERHTGIDFQPAMDPAQQQALERTVPSMW